MRSFLKVSLLLCIFFLTRALLACVVTITPSSPTVQSGGQVQFHASITPASCGQDVSWASNIGSITSAGLFTAPLVTHQTGGLIRATEKVAPNAMGQTSVTVTPPTLSSITVTPASASILVGNTRQFTATGNYSDGTMQNLTSTATWSSTLPSVATVSTGLATGVAAGTTTIKATLGVSGSASLTVTAPPAAIQASFFALDINKNNNVGTGVTNDPWPSNGGGVNFGTFRTLGSAIKWSDIETCDGGPNQTNPCYTWTRFDQWRAQLQSGQAMMFTAFWTPAWASGFAADTCTGIFVPGGCDLPSDVTTTDQHWKDFLIALINHVGVGGLKYLEVWNEPNITSECNPPNNPMDLGGTCTPASLVRMVQDAQCVIKGIGTGCAPGLDPSVQIISPPPTSAQPGGTTIAPYLGTLLADRVANYADIIGFHGYVNLGSTIASSTAAGTTNVASLITSVQTTVAPYSTTKPIYDTEGSWSGKYEAQIQPYPDQQAAFVGIYYLIQGSNADTTCSGTVCNPLAGFSWYGWDFTNTGQFWDLTNQVRTPGGVAYVNVYQWLQGASPTAPCSASGTVWTCNFTRTGNYYAQAVWDTNQTCPPTTGNCTTSIYTLPQTPAGTPYIEYRDLSGNIISLSGATTVAIGLKPILLDNNSAY